MQDDALASHWLAIAAHPLPAAEIRKPRPRKGKPRGVALRVSRQSGASPATPLPAVAMRTILAPIDFSDSSRPVVAQAVGLARAFEARIVLLHVHSPPPRLVRDATLAESGAELASAMETEASRRLAKLQEELRQAGVVAHALHRHGHPGHVIVQQAERLQADYIVIGSHGHTAFYDLIVGSTTTRVLKDATCRVVIIPVGASGASGRRA